MQWDEFYRYLIVFLVTSTAWSVFKDDLSQQQRGPLGGIKVVSGESNCRFVMIDDIEVDEIVVGSREAGIGGAAMLAGWYLLPGVAV